MILDCVSSRSKAGSKKIAIATYRVLLLLDLNDRAVLESPLDNIGLLVGVLDVLRRLEGRPELGEVLDLDQVPDVGQRGADDGRLADGGGGGDGRHGGGFVCGLLKGVWVMCCWYWKKEGGLRCILWEPFVAAAGSALSLHTPPSVLRVFGAGLSLALID